MVSSNQLHIFWDAFSILLLTDIFVNHLNYIDDQEVCDAFWKQRFLFWNRCGGEEKKIQHVSILLGYK